MQNQRSMVPANSTTTRPMKSTPTNTLVFMLSTSRKSVTARTMVASTQTNPKTVTYAA